MTTDTSPDALASVTQADRDAAASFAWTDGDVATMQLRYDIQEGKRDNHPLVQAFYRHRLAYASRTSAAEMDRVMREAHLASVRVRQPAPIANAGEREDAEWQRMRVDILAGGTGIMRDGKRIDPADFYIDPTPPDAAERMREVGEMAAFGASEAACYLYPGEDQAPERAAFCEGAARAVSALPSPAVPADDAVISEFAMLYREYGLADDSTLAPCAIDLKRKVLAALTPDPAK